MADEAVQRLADRLGKGLRAAARGSCGSSTSYLAAAVARLARRPVLLMVAHVDDADEAVDELTAVGVEAVRFAALETLPGESAVSLELLAERLGALQSISAWAGEPDGGAGRVIVASIQALMQAVPRAENLGESLRLLRVGETPEGGLAGLLRWLDSAGFERTAAVEEPGDFATRGGILDVFPPGDPNAPGPDGEVGSGGGAPIRLDFFGDQLERISEIALETMGSGRSFKAVRLVTAKGEMTQRDAGTCSFLEVLPRGTVAILHELQELTEQGRGYYERCTDTRGIFGPPAVFKMVGERLHASALVGQHSALSTGVEGEVIVLPVSAVPQLTDDAGKAVTELGSMATGAEGPALRVVVLCNNEGERQRLGELVEQFAPAARERVESLVAYTHAGFIWDPSLAGAKGEATLFLPYHELLQRYQARRSARGGVGAGGRRLKAGRAMDTFLELAVGDYVVHNEHGIAKFVGLRLMKKRDAKASYQEKFKGDADSATPESYDEAEEYLTLEFDGGAKVHVPAVKIALVQKYIGGFRGSPPLSTLGGTRWKNQKQRAAEGVKDLAASMLRIRAAREHLPGIRFPGDTPWQQEFEAEFAFDETEDQLAAMGEIKKDMQNQRPMDRLICGDVGYGKTELAIRAAFKAVEYGKQAAVLVPTTVLAEQHERTFRSRFKDYPFKVESISRFKTDAEVRAVLKELAEGRVDLIIGTHRLLSKDVKFVDLGLVVIDEEQRFGVEHKERLLGMRMTADVLTLSATPIPRTLHMSMLGLRDISSLTTPPADRRAVVTEVIPYNRVRVQQAINRELSRQGQVYYVHNRVHDILSVADELQKMAPTARIVVGHGQMADGELESVMLKFMRRDADILVCTTIIESGIDNPTANTMIIQDADRFGLADLHQLRGRVGRYKHRAYCYLLLPEDRPVRDTALKRLKAIEQYSMLGAGFKIAMRDLEIRGAGNILGAEQSGHIAAVGYDMYCQLLERAVKELRNEVIASPNETSVEIAVSGVIPRPYIPSDQRRLEAYRRLSLAATIEELATVERDLIAAYGDPPKPTRRLLDLAEIRIGARLLGVRTISIRGQDVIFGVESVDALVKRFEGIKGSVRPLPPKGPGELAEVYFRPVSAAALEPGTITVILKKRLRPEPG